MNSWNGQSQLLVRVTVNLFCFFLFFFLYEFDLQSISCDRHLSNIFNETIKAIIRGGVREELQRITGTYLQDRARKAISTAV